MTTFLRSALGRSRGSTLPLFLATAALAGAFTAVLLDEDGVAPAAPALKEDTVLLAAGEEVKGILDDLTETSVAIRVGETTRRFAREDVSEIRRSADDRVLQFFAKKAEEYRAATDQEKSTLARRWQQLADLCVKQQAKQGVSYAPERRTALREIIRLDPARDDLRAELGHARLEGEWLDAEAVAVKLAEGYNVVDGSLVRDRSTVVRTNEPVPEVYNLLRGEALNDRARERYEKERQKRLDSAERFLEQKHREYEGIPWNQRHKIRTRHFEIHCNSTRQVAQAYGVLMELIRGKLAEMFKSGILRNLRAPVFVYASQDSFIENDRLGPWGGPGLGGYYMPSTQQISCFHGTFGFTGTTFGVLCHEGTHYYQGLVLKDFAHIPIWLIEGLAVYFGDGSTFDPKSGKIEVGKIPRDRLAHIQEKMAYDRHTPIKELVTMKRGFGGFTGSHYADAWALIYFLVNSGTDGKRLMVEYWARGMEQQLNKKHFTDLAEKYFGSYDEMQKQYEAYILALRPPSAGEVQGEYFVSDYFQFDIKLPGAEWAYFEDTTDKKLLIGCVHESSPAEAEVRIYFYNNMEKQDAEDFFKGYVKSAEAQHSDLQHGKTRIAGLDGFKLEYVDLGKEESGESVSIRIENGKPVIDRQERKAKEKARKGPRDTVEYLLVQIDGVVSIKCSARKGEGAQLTREFEALKDSFTLMLTRRW